MSLLICYVHFIKLILSCYICVFSQLLSFTFWHFNMNQYIQLALHMYLILKQIYQSAQQK